MDGASKHIKGLNRLKSGPYDAGARSLKFLKQVKGFGAGALF